MTRLPLPTSERLLLGPGPSIIAPRVMRAMAAPVLSHLDGDLVALLDDVRARLGRVFQADDGAFTFAVSGTGTSGMEAVVANMVGDGTRVLAVVTGYFGDRLAEMCRRYGADVTRLEVTWGRAVDPEAVRAALDAAGPRPFDVVACVHAETSTGVLNPVKDVATVAHEFGALVIVDAVTSFGGHPLDVAGWDLDAVYSCTQKCIGAPSGMAPVAWTPAAQARRVACRSFYFDMGLLETTGAAEYHHTLSSTLIYALQEALVAIEEEGLERRWQRHERHHRALAAGLEAMGLGLLPPGVAAVVDAERRLRPRGCRRGGRAPHVAAGVLDGDWRRARAAGGEDWRVGLMGASSTPSLVLLFLSALEHALRVGGPPLPPRRRPRPAASAALP